METGNEKVCPQQKLLAIFAGDQIRRDRRIKSPSVSWALMISLCQYFAEEGKEMLKQRFITLVLS